VFKSVFPIKDFTGSASLEFVSYRFGEVKHSVEECIHRGMTYEPSYGRIYPRRSRWRSQAPPWRRASSRRAGGC